MVILQMEQYQLNNKIKENQMGRSNKKKCLNCGCRIKRGMRPIDVPDGVVCSKQCNHVIKQLIKQMDRDLRMRATRY
jgi:hypothetical protein